MELTLTTFFGLSEEHAARIMALDETSRNKKIEEYRLTCQFMTINRSKILVFVERVPC